MPSTFTPNKSYELQATGENAGTWGIKLDAVESIIDLNLGGRFNANVAGAANVTVTTAQAQNVRHILTGLLTGNIQYIFPNGGAFYIVTNNTTGAFTVALANAGGGATVAIAQGQTLLIFINPDTPSVEQITGTNNPGLLANMVTAGGTANAITATFSPALTALTAGQIVAFIAASANTAGTTFAPNGLTAKNITKFGTVALQGGEIIANAIVLLGYDGTQWQLLSSIPADGTAQWGGTSGGSATAQTITLPTSPGAYKTGMVIRWASGFAPGAGLTINANGLGAKTVVDELGNAIASVSFQNGAILQAVYTGSQFQLTGVGPWAVLNAINAFTKSQGGPAGALTDAATITWDASLIQEASVTLAAAHAFGAPSNITTGQVYDVLITTGGFNPSWNAAFIFDAGGAPALASFTKALVSFRGDGSNMRYLGFRGYAS